MSASTFKWFTQSALEQFNPAASDAATSTTASMAAKFGAIASQASVGIAADAADAFSLNAAAATAWATDAKAMGRAAVPW